MNINKGMQRSMQDKVKNRIELWTKPLVLKIGRNEKKSSREQMMKGKLNIKEGKNRFNNEGHRRNKRENKIE